MPTWTTYRQQTAKELGAFWSGTSDNVAMTTTTMKVSGWPISSSVYSDRRYRDWMLMIPSAAAADRVRLIGTYTPTPTPAVFTTDLVWSGAAVPQNKAFELHAHGFNPDVELLDFVNEALKAILIERETTVAVSATSQATRTPVLYSWVQNASWALQFGYLNSGESRNVVDPYGDDRTVFWRPAQDGSNIFIEHPDNTFSTETLYLKAKCRAYDYCTAGGILPFGTQSGLALETDSAYPDEHWVSAGARVIAWDRAAGLMEDAAQKRRVASQQKALEEFRRWETVYWDAARKRLGEKPRRRPLEYGVPGSLVW